MKQHIEWVREQADRRRNFILYSLIGVSGASLDMALYWVLTNLGIPMQFANFCSVNAGISNNFLLNAKYNFRVTDKVWRRFASFYLVGMVGWGLSAVFLFVGVTWWGFPQYPVKFLSIVFVVITQYTLNKLFSFAPSSLGDSGSMEGE